jgi:hypothetical protein
MGIGLPGIRNGDIVYDPLGSRTPFVLHRVGETFLSDKGLQRWHWPSINHFSDYHSRELSPSTSHTSASHRKDSFSIHAIGKLILPNRHCFGGITGFVSARMNKLR